MWRCLLLFWCSCVSSSASGNDENNHQPPDWRIRLLIVAGREARDGHRRLFRTALGVNIPAQMISVEDESQELSQILRVIQQEPYRPDDMVVVINSDEYIVAGDPAVASWKIALEATKQEAEIILPYPPPAFKNTRRLQQQIEEVTNELVPYRVSSGIKPYSSKEAEDVQRLLYTLRRLEVEDKQNYRDFKMNANTRDFGAYAFAGLTTTISETLQDLQEKEHLKTVKELWHSAVNNLTLRYRYGLAFDDNYIIYQDATTINTGSFSYRKGDSGVLSLHAQVDVLIAPFVHARHSEMPFVASNIMAKEIGATRSCSECPDEPLPDASPLEGADHPTVQIIVLIDHELPFVRLFLQRLRELKYPKEKLSLCVYVSAETLLDEVEAYIAENMNEYFMVQILPASEMDDYERMRYFIKKANTKLMPDYLFVVEASAHLTNPDTLQILINKRRNIVGPLLRAKAGDRSNIETDYVQGQFAKGAVYSNYVDKRTEDDSGFNLNGLLQVSKITSAVLLSYQTYSDVVLSDKRPKESHWNSFYRQILEQGYIPYVSNEDDYGYLISEPGEYRPDIWSVDRNENEFLNFYLIPVSADKQGSNDAPSDEDEEEKHSHMCRHFRKDKIFNSHYTKDLLSDTKKSSWRVISSRANEPDVLEPPGEMSILQNIYVQSVIRYFTRNKDLEIPVAGGKMLVFQGSGHLTLQGSMNVIMSMADQKVSTLEFKSNEDKDKWDVPSSSPLSSPSSSSSSCLLKLRQGEGIFITSPNPWNITLAETTNIVVFSL
ncbi:uncharacterized protein LOC135206483 [Macrobrachium nipponense]|uniref:uncharacterized protein LOC135206483 n=1 Tax=Macrobrachium nipponense TaxID=159736 RepID=UPI0030C7E207